MRTSFVAVLTVMGAVAILAASESQAYAEENCYSVRATAEARNPERATERAEHRLHRHIADELRSATGKTVGPVTT